MLTLYHIILSSTNLYWPSTTKYHPVSPCTDPVPSSTSWFHLQFIISQGTVEPGEKFLFLWLISWVTYSILGLLGIYYYLYTRIYLRYTILFHHYDQGHLPMQFLIAVKMQYSVDASFSYSSTFNSNLWFKRQYQEAKGYKEQHCQKGTTFGYFLGVHCS